MSYDKIPIFLSFADSFPGIINNYAVAYVTTHTCFDRTAPPNKIGSVFVLDTVRTVQVSTENPSENPTPKTGLTFNKPRFLVITR